MDTVVGVPHILLTASAPTQKTTIVNTMNSRADGDMSPNADDHTPPHRVWGAVRRGWQSPEIEPKDAESIYSRHTSHDHDDARSDSQDDNQDEESFDDRRASLEYTKRSRYLREADRHIILQRIDNGEKQAELAREFGVTQAAICHINKNRVEILARSSRPDVHAAARHPKRRMSREAIAQRQHYQRLLSERSSRVYEAASAAMAVHMTTIQSPQSDSQTFRMAADRVSWLLLEEALAVAGTSHDDQSSHRPTCAMVMTEGGYPLLHAFRALQPDRPIGFLSLVMHEPTGDVTLHKMSAPLDLRDQTILLLDATCRTASEVVVAVQSLLDFGAKESRIVFVTLVVNAAAIDRICTQFSTVRVVAAAVDVNDVSDVSNFCERYFNATTIRQNGLGSRVNL